MKLFNIATTIIMTTFSSLAHSVSLISDTINVGVLIEGAPTYSDVISSEIIGSSFISLSYDDVLRSFSPVTVQIQSKSKMAVEQFSLIVNYKSMYCNDGKDVSNTPPTLSSDNGGIIENSGKLTFVGSNRWKEINTGNPDSNNYRYYTNFQIRISFPVIEMKTSQQKCTGNVGLLNVAEIF